MDRQIISKLQKTFEEYAQNEQGIEFWFARTLQILLGYDKWENFVQVIEKAKIACKNSECNINNQFPEVRKTVEIGFGAEREIEDVMLTR